MFTKSRNNSKRPFLSYRRNMVLVALLYTFMWGCGFPLVKICMDSFSIGNADQSAKCLVAGIRFTFSGLITLLCFSIFSSDKKPLSLNKKELLFSGSYGIIATSLQYAFTFIGLSMIDGSKGAVYDQLGVFVIVLTSGLFFRSEKLTLKKIVGCILGFVGVLFINISSAGFSFTLLGEGVMLLAVICQTTSYYVAKASSDTIAAPKLVGYGQLIGGILLFIAAFILGGRIHTVNAAAIISLILLILISALAYTLSLMPLKYFPVSEVSSFNLLITVFGVVMSAALLGENVFRLNYLISLTLISLGIFFINAKEKANCPKP